MYFEWFSLFLKNFLKGFLLWTFFFSRQRRFWLNEKNRDLRFALSCVCPSVCDANPTLPQYFFLCELTFQVGLFFYFLTQLMGAFPPNRNLGTLFWSDFSAIERFAPRSTSWWFMKEIMSWVFNRSRYVRYAFTEPITVGIGRIRPISALQKMGFRSG